MIPDSNSHRQPSAAGGEPTNPELAEKLEVLAKEIAATFRNHNLGFLTEIRNDLKKGDSFGSFHASVLCIECLNLSTAFMALTMEGGPEGIATALKARVKAVTGEMERIALATSIASKVRRENEKKLPPKPPTTNDN